MNEIEFKITTVPSIRISQNLEPTEQFIGHEPWSKTHYFHVETVTVYVSYRYVIHIGEIPTLYVSYEGVGRALKKDGTVGNSRRNGTITAKSVPPEIRQRLEQRAREEVIAFANKMNEVLAL